MREVLDELLRWWRAGDPVGVASVIATSRSAPRTAGATLLVGPGGRAVGSVSGGCVEAAVYELAREVAVSAKPVLARYGVTGGDDPFAIGLTCGGTLDVYVERVDRRTFPELGGIAASVARQEPVAVVTCVSCTAPGRSRLGRRLVVRTDRTTGTLGGERLDLAVAQDARGMLARGGSGTLRYGLDGRRTAEELTMYVASYAPRPRMLVFGAIDFAAAVARIGGFLGYRVTVCDAREVFTTPERFPGADDVVVQWPHRYLAAEAAAGRIDSRTVICALTHDPKFDVPLLDVALGLPVAYVGAMGSRRTQADRVRRLRDAGVPQERIALLSAPIGLDIGAGTPEETAVSIAAEIVRARRSGSGRPLSTLTDQPIHRTAWTGAPPV
ncbi:XdhC family protein [Streptomyces sp. NPDC102274]|uniref:XdhC family protein n=1 Tax=Streptomyces sp. NPDC102274 TaxID=3366151 RepID=UPI00380BCE98